MQTKYVIASGDSVIILDATPESMDLIRSRLMYSCLIFRLEDYAQIRSLAIDALYSSYGMQPIEGEIITIRHSESAASAARAT